MDTVSRQLQMDVWLGQSLTEEVVESVLEIIRASTTVLEEFEYRYPVMGKTVVLILSESHFVLHSYPENDYFSLDLYVCNVSTDLEGIASKVLDRLEVKDYKKDITWRGKQENVSENRKNGQEHG